MAKVHHAIDTGDLLVGEGRIMILGHHEALYVADAAVALGASGVSIGLLRRWLRDRVESRRHDRNPAHVGE